MSDYEYFSRQFKNLSESDKKKVKGEILLRKKYHEELLSPEGDDFPEAALTHLKKKEDINRTDIINKIKNSGASHILLYGAPVLAREFIYETKCPIINLHMGVSTKYRGGMANYIALFHSDYQNVGYTIHHVAEKIDAGKIIYVGKYDSYSAGDNYPKINVFLLKDAIKNLIELIPHIDRREEAAERDIPKLIPNEKFLIEHLKKVQSDFKSQKHLAV